MTMRIIPARVGVSSEPRPWRPAQAGRQFVLRHDGSAPQPLPAPCKTSTSVFRCPRIPRTAFTPSRNPATPTPLDEAGPISDTSRGGRAIVIEARHRHVRLSGYGSLHAVAIRCVHHLGSFWGYLLMHCGGVQIACSAMRSTRSTRSAPGRRSRRRRRDCSYTGCTNRLWVRSPLRAPVWA
jgi:hypothetical protein